MITSPELRSFLRTKNVLPNQELIADAKYVLPAKSWIEVEFSRALERFYDALKVAYWLDESNDCDDFARGAAYFAQLLHARTRRYPGTALAFGEFWYLQKSGGGHAINFFLYKDPDGALQVGYYEPQTRQVVELDPDETRYCLGFRI